MEQEDEFVADSGVEPGERQHRVGRFEVIAVVTNFDDENAIFGQMLLGFTQDDAREIEAVFARAERQFRFVQVFRR